MSISYQVPLVLAGTVEGTVFAFAVYEPPGDAFPPSVTGGGRGVSTPSGVGVGKAGLGRVLMKFEHTRRRIHNISCSRYQVWACIAGFPAVLGGVSSIAVWKRRSLAAIKARPVQYFERDGDESFVDTVLFFMMDLGVGCEMGPSGGLVVGSCAHLLRAKKFFCDWRLVVTFFFLNLQRCCVLQQS